MKSSGPTGTEPGPPANKNQSTLVHLKAADEEVFTASPRTSVFFVFCQTLMFQMINRLFLSLLNQRNTVRKDTPPDFAKNIHFFLVRPENMNSLGS